MPDQKGGATLEDYLDALRFGLPNIPHLAHRLDRDTSGCLILGRHKKALTALGRLFEHGSVSKTYFAIVHGKPEPEAGTIDQPTGKTFHRQTRLVDDGRSLTAKTGDD